MHRCMAPSDKRERVVDGNMFGVSACLKLGNNKNGIFQVIWAEGRRPMRSCHMRQYQSTFLLFLLPTSIK